MSSTSHVEHQFHPQPRGFFTPQPTWKTRRYSTAVPASERKPITSNERFHVIQKVPSGDSPYVRAKHVQLVDKDPCKAVSLFWSAINSGDRVESALKDMASVLRQLDRSDEAIEAIKSFRHLCPHESQESIDNLLLELYKVAGKYEEEIEMLLLKVKQLEEGFLSGGKRKKIARTQGRKVEITIEKEYSRLLGNLAWTYMQQQDFKSAEEYYRKSLLFESNKNKQCNLALCLMHMNKLIEAKFLLQAIKPSDGHIDESYVKSYERASQTLSDMQSQRALKHIKPAEFNSGFCRQQNHEGCQTPPVPHFLNKMNKRVSTDFPYEKQADFDRRIDCRSYESPHSSRESPRVPYTQPRRCPWSFNGPDQRKSEEHFRRKLPFVQCPEGENRQSLVNRYPCNYSSVTCASPKLLLPSPHRDWRGKFVDNLEKAKKGPGEPFVRNENRSRSCLFVYDGNLKPAGECDLASDSTSTADTTKTKTVSSMEPVQSCVRPETVKTCDPQTGCRKTIELSTPEPKKCWADLVEEDEQEPENWRKQFSIGLADKGGCNDENVDIKVVSETPLVEKSSQELQSLDLEAGGYFTQPDKVNQKVKRSLCFDQRQEENQCTSPFKIKAFDFEGH